MCHERIIAYWPLECISARLSQTMFLFCSLLRFLCCSIRNSTSPRWVNSSVCLLKYNDGSSDLAIFLSKLEISLFKIDSSLFSRCILPPRLVGFFITGICGTSSCVFLFVLSLYFSMLIFFGPAFSILLVPCN